MQVKSIPLPESISSKPFSFSDCLRGAEIRCSPGHMRFAYGIVSSALESVATEIKRYKSGIGIGLELECQTITLSNPRGLEFDNFAKI